MSANRNLSRRSKGTPTGGQFTGKSNPESDIELDGDTVQFEPPAADDRAGGTTRPPHKAGDAGDRLDTMRERRAAMAAEDAKAEPYRRHMGTDAGQAAIVATLVASAAGAIRDVDAYLVTAKKRLVAEERDESAIGEPRRNQQARWAWHRTCEEKSQALGRKLTVEEEDDLAERHLESCAPGRRPTPGYHRRPQVLYDENLAYLETPERPAVTSAATPTDNPELVDLARSHGVVTLRHEALGCMVRGVGGPDVLPASVSQRESKRIRDEVMGAGGPLAVAETWRGGPTPLAAPWGTNGVDELDDDQRRAIVGVVASLQPSAAETTWLGAMTVASARSAYR